MFAVRAVYGLATNAQRTACALDPVLVIAPQNCKGCEKGQLALNLFCPVSSVLVPVRHRGRWVYARGHYAVVTGRAGSGD